MQKIKFKDLWLCSSSQAFSKAFSCKELQTFVIGFEKLHICFILTVVFWFDEQSKIILMIFVQFQAVKSKLQRKSHDQEIPNKYADIDASFKQLDRKLKEGRIMQTGPRGSNKVSAIAEQLSGHKQEPEKPTIQRSVSNYCQNRLCQQYYRQAFSCAPEYRKM